MIELTRCGAPDNDRYLPAEPAARALKGDVPRVVGAGLVPARGRPQGPPLQGCTEWFPRGAAPGPAEA